MAQDSHQWDFFLAHAGVDSSIAEALYDLLALHSNIFLDSRCLLFGDDWDEELILAQSKSLVTIVLVSPHTDKAYYQREEIANAIVKVLGDDALRQEMMRKGLERSKIFSWKKCARETLDAFELVYRG